MEQIKRTVRSEADKNLITNRLNKIEGQIRGIKKMVEDDRYCVDIFVQVSAVQAALNAVDKILLTYHIKNCVSENIRLGNDDVIDELCETVQKLMK